MKHFTRGRVFLGAPCYERLDRLFEGVIEAAARHVPSDEPIRLRFDDTTTKKTGRKIEGASGYRNGAGTARQEWRTLFGLNFVLGAMRIRLSAWPDGFVSVPIGLALYLKKQAALDLGRPYRTRSALARAMLDQVCRLVGPDRTVLSVQDGDYSTKAFLLDLPKNARVVGRLPISSPLYGRAEPKQPGTPGPQAQIGPPLGNPKELAEASAWQAHPDEEDAEVLVVEGFWHTVMPGHWLRVLIVRRPEEKLTKQKNVWVSCLVQLDSLNKWLETLAEVSFEVGLTPAQVSHETIRQAIHALGTSWKRAKHWITSPDEQYALKKSNATA